MKSSQIRRMLRKIESGDAHLFIVIIGLFSLLAGCGSRDQQATANQPTWHIEQVLSRTENRETLSQMIEVEHCTTPALQVVECPAGTENSFTYDLADTDHTRAAIADNVRAELGIVGQENSRLNLTVPPQGFVYRYQITKRFDVLRGTVIGRSSTGNQREIAYTFVSACEIVTQSRQTFDCSGTAVAEPTPSSADPQPAPTAVLIATPIATITPMAPDPALGQNCPSPPHETFAAVWDSYRTLLGCSTSEMTVIPTLAEEAFQGGHLFWRSDTDQVYIILDRQKADGQELSEGRWQLNPSDRRWDGSDPDGIGLDPPPGLVEPARGFGWLWRNHLGRENGPLGWALDREYGFDNIGQAQRFEQGLMFKGSGPKIYVLMNSGVFFVE